MAWAALSFPLQITPAVRCESWFAFFHFLLGVGMALSFFQLMSKIFSNSKSITPEPEN